LDSAAKEFKFVFPFGIEPGMHLKITPIEGMTFTDYAQQPCASVMSSSEITGDCEVSGGILEITNAVSEQ